MYVNGAPAGEHRGGYTAFCFDVSELLVPGEENLIAVRVSNAVDPDVPPLSGDFTSFGGLYRSVYLLATAPLSVTPLDCASPGVYLTPFDISPSGAGLEVKVKLRNGAAVDKDALIRATVVDAEANVVALLEWNEPVPAGAVAAESAQIVGIEEPHLWNGRQDPYLYNVYVEVWDGETLADLVSQPLGLRSFQVDADQGFFLNGVHLDLRGAGLHQDWDRLGWAIGPDQHDADFALIQEMGCTAVRLAHYPHAPYVYDLCDRAGLVVWTEIPLVNSITDSPAFTANAQQQLRELIRQNYNHPSVCFWGLANEVDDTFAVRSLLGALAQEAKSEDPFRLTTHATDINSGTLNGLVDVVAFNKYFGWYGGSFSDFPAWADARHEEYPNKGIGMSEFGAGASPFQHHPNPMSVVWQSTFHPEEYQSRFHEAHWIAMKSRPYLWCKFVWNMFDFASDSRHEGDTAGRNDKGLVTRDRRVRKDAFYWYKANWSEEPVLYVTSRRFSPRDQATAEVKVYSNCDRVELFHNGQSWGWMEASAAPDRIFRWTPVSLAMGVNLIEVHGEKSGQAYSDSCVWFRESPVHNDPPTVSLSEPAEGRVFVAPANITLRAQAADPDGSILRVEFYAGETLIGEDSDGSDDWCFVWRKVPAGHYRLTARAVDNLGVATTSSAVNVSVQGITVIGVTPVPVRVPRPTHIHPPTP